jgi:hypothetical protein
VTVARNVLQQYRHWQEVFAGDVVLMQIGAFIEKLQWPPRRLSPPGRGEREVSAERRRRMRPTRRGALWGFPADQLDRRVAALLRAGRAVTLVAQTGRRSGRIEERRPVRRMHVVHAASLDYADLIDVPGQGHGQIRSNHLHSDYS